MWRDCALLCVRAPGIVGCAGHSRDVQGRLAARAHDLRGGGGGMTENLSGNLQLQLETLELYQNNLSNSAPLEDAAKE